jgi:hypothetical protein
MKTATLLKRLTPALLLPLALPLIAAADAPGYSNQNTQHAPYRPRITTLVDKVYDKNIQFRDINVARGQLFHELTTCVSGPETGAMGVHMVQDARVDGKVNPEEPEVLIYEPLANGYMRLVGVEFIVPAALWKPTKEHPTPSVEGNLMNFVPGPNRYGPDALYELHVWAFERNPLGAFADWNVRVSCEKQPVE